MSDGASRMVDMRGRSDAGAREERIVAASCRLGGEECGRRWLRNVGVDDRVRYLCE